MSVAIFIREVDANAYVATDADGKFVLSMTLADGLRFPNIPAAQEGHLLFRDKTIGMRLEMVAADPDRPDIEPKSMGELDDLQKVPRVPVIAGVALFAELKKSSKYYHQFQGAKPVTHIIPPSYGDDYCFRVAHNAYRHEDLIFSVMVAGELVRLDKWTTPKPAKRERQVAA